MLGMTAWHIWTDQARAVDRRGLRTSKPGFSALCREVKSQTIGGRFRNLIPGHARRSSSYCWRMITCIKASKQLKTSRRGFCRERAFAEKGDIAQAAGSPAGRPSLLASSGPRRSSNVHVTHTLMTHCLQSNSIRQGRRRRGETKAWHAQRRAPPPRRRRRHAHQRERLDQCGF